MGRSTWTSLLAALPLFASSTGGGEAAFRPPDTAPSADELMAQLAKKYGPNDKKYEALLKKVEKEVRKVLSTTVWLSEQEAGRARLLQEQPLFALIATLSAPGQLEGNKKHASALVGKFPWSEVLQLPEGLEFGSDRPIPPNENGFIELGAGPDPFPGYPELFVNQYLFGLREIVGWQNGVEAKKKLAFRGRTSKEPAAPEKELPAWEALRVYLQGSLPEVPLFAIPRLTHAIHARLAERRAGAPGERAKMDEFAALLDSKWNGFRIQTPYGKEPIAIVQPVHALMADRNGFLYRFAPSAELASAGDLPFVSVQTLMQYAQAFRNEKLSPGDFISNTPAGKAAGDEFWASCTYLGRYRALIDEFVRAVLAPNLRYPAYMSYLDYPEGKLPGERAVGADFDVPRRHALLVWAYVGKDPVKLADFLHENLLDAPAQRFPSDVGLPAAFTQLVREREAELVQSVAARIAEERKLAGAAGDFEREFAPYAAYLDSAGDPAADYLAASFHSFHGQALKAVQDAARAVVQLEIGK